MPTIVQITLRTDDGIPENFVTNQFALTGEVASPTDADSVAVAFKDFYDDITSGILSSLVAQNNHVVKFYDAGGPAPNYPFYETTFNLGANPSGTTLPSEVAICLSFQGARSAGLPQARRRGRVYIGPVKNTPNTDNFVNTTARNLLITSAQTLYDAIDAVASAGSWAVWSTTDGQAVPLTDCWVDDVFDTQRSRGATRTTRSTGSFI